MAHVQCMMFELPHIVASLLESKRMNYGGGDMLVSIPFVDAILIMVCNFVVYAHFLLLFRLLWFLSLHCLY